MYWEQKVVYQAQPVRRNSSKTPSVPPKTHPKTDAGYSSSSSTNSNVYRSMDEQLHSCKVLRQGMQQLKDEMHFISVQLSEQPHTANLIKQNFRKDDEQFKRNKSQNTLDSEDEDHCASDSYEDDCFAQ
ncbi:hypothetical protein Nepgr_028877 [Nepenthes gracilis]|uniref:Uncharacterized protein n=1 Tax=Nepenthes gracilis TaxID=150966 RepID=A0AAD3TDP5_NEPGR|nr:hypothetical protein Nepgr_028877 [Nepenthes gracilis]